MLQILNISSQKCDISYDHYPVVSQAVESRFHQHGMQFNDLLAQVRTFWIERRSSEDFYFTRMKEEPPPPPVAAGLPLGLP